MVGTRVHVHALDARLHGMVGTVGTRVHVHSQRARSYSVHVCHVVEQ